MTADQWIALVAGILGGALRVGVPFLFVSLGECLTEKSGRINLGLEGVLVLSAMVAFGGAYQSGSAWVGVLAGAVAGGLLGALTCVVRLGSAYWRAQSPVGCWQRCTVPCVPCHASTMWQRVSH